MRLIRSILVILLLLTTLHASAVEYGSPEADDQEEVEDARDQWAKLRQQPDLTDKSGTQTEFSQLLRAATSKRRNSVKEKASKLSKKAEQKKDKAALEKTVDKATDKTTDKPEDGLKNPEASAKKPAPIQPPLGESKAKSPDGTTKSAF